MNFDNLTERALRALCEQIGAGRVRRENLRAQFRLILADLGGVSPATIDTTLSFMPGVVLNAMYAKVDALWAECNKAGVKPPRQAIDEALGLACGIAQAGAGHGSPMTEAAVRGIFFGGLAAAAGIPVPQAELFFAEHADDAHRARLAECGGGFIDGTNEASKGGSVLPWLVVLGIAAKVLL